MFPQGGPGVGLLILRLSVAAILVMNAANGPGSPSNYILLAAALLVATSLAVGFLTPYLSFVVCATAIAKLLLASSPTTNISAPFICSIMDAIALMLLGPGAYSLDARLFGRRVIIVPPSKS